MDVVEFFFFGITAVIALTVATVTLMRIPLYVGFCPRLSCSSAM